MSLENKSNKKLKSLVANGKIDKVFDVLLNSVDENTSKENEIISLSNQFKLLKKRETLNLSIDTSERNDLIYSLLELIDEIDDNSEKGFDFLTPNRKDKIKKRNKVITISITASISIYALYLIGVPIVGVIILLISLVISLLAIIFNIISD